MWKIIVASFKQSYCKAVFLFLLLSSLFLWIQRWPMLADPDSFYHAKMAVFLSHGEIVRDFPWLPLTVMSEHFSDHHFLYHILLVPFVSFADPLIGVKASIVALGAGLASLYFLILRRFKIPYAFVLTLLAFTTSPFLSRLNLVKALPVSLAIYFLGLLCLKEEKKWPLALLSFIYVWAYAGWPLLLVTVIVYTIVSIILNYKDWRRSLNFLVASLAGSLAGIIINPYWPHNLWFYKRQIIDIALNPLKTTGVGVEWYHMPVSDFYFTATPLWLFLIFLSSAILFFWLSNRRLPFNTFQETSFAATVAILTFGLFIATMISRRYVEYFIPISYLLVGILLMVVMREMPSKIILWQSRYRIAAIAFFLTMTIIVYIGQSVVVLARQYDDGYEFTRWRRVSEWMKINLAPNTLVFNVQWDNFPQLFYWNTNLRYVSGLDIRFFNEPASTRLSAWQEIFTGDSKDPVSTISNVFQSKYVLVTNLKGPARKLFDEHKFPILYEDNEAILYAVPD